MTEGIGISRADVPEPHTANSTIRLTGAGGGSPWFPSPVIHDGFNAFSIVDSVAAIKTSKTRRFMGGGESELCLKAFKTAMAMPPAVTEKTRMDVLRKIAADVYAPDIVDELVDSWYTLRHAGITMGAGMIDVIWGPFMLRWLVRPFVAWQDMLTSPERAYWEPYLYNSAKADPGTYLQYTHSFSHVPETWEEAMTTCCAIDSAAGQLASAAEGLLNASKKTASKTASTNLKLEYSRVRAMRCLTLSVRHYLHLGALTRMHEKELAANPHDTTSDATDPEMTGGNFGSNGLFFLHRAMRWELDNTYELIDLIEKSPVPLIYTEKDPKWEISLLYGPDLLQNLKKKVEITLKYWRTAEKGYYLTTKGG